MIRLYAFLGNYGREYAGNRHNVAWQFLDSLPLCGELRWERGFKGSYAVLDSSAAPSERLWFLKPETYMNLSGDSVAELMRFYRIDTAELLIIHDDLEMPFGCFGFKMGGGLGGHNGLRSMEARLGTRDFARMRFGIGRPTHDDVAAYVLSDFSHIEQEALCCDIFPQAAKALSLCMDEGFDKALARFPKTKACDAHTNSSR